MESYEVDEVEVEAGKEPISADGVCYPPAEADYQQVVEDAEFFLHKLRDFHSSFGTHFSSPSLGQHQLDLHRLFVEVSSRGGIDQVVRDRKWKEVISAFKLPTARNSGSFALRRYYMSLLYHFEQVYLFGKDSQTAVVAGSINQVTGKRSAEEPTGEVYVESAGFDSSAASPELQPGVSLVGVIDKKFDNGYVVSVNLGFDQLKGILYHIPDKPQPSWSPNSCITQHQKRKKSQLALLDSAKSKPARSYNFFSEHNVTPRPNAQGQECMSNEIGHLLNNLSETENSSAKAKE